MKRIVCVMTALLLLTVCGCAEQEDAVVYPKVDEKVALFDGCDSSTEKHTYAELAQQADWIIVADMQEVIETPGNNGTAGCMATVSVREVLKGDIPNGAEIVVQENGWGYTSYVGEDGQLHATDPFEVTSRTTLCGGPMMVKGNRVLLFLSGEGDDLGSEENPYDITPGSSGKFYLDRDGKYHNSMLYYKDYDENTHKFYSQLADMEPKTLDEIKTLING